MQRRPDEVRTIENRPMTPDEALRLARAKRRTDQIEAVTEHLSARLPDGWVPEIGFLNSRRWELTIRDGKGQVVIRSEGANLQRLAGQIMRELERDAEPRPRPRDARQHPVAWPYPTDLDGFLAFVSPPPADDEQMRATVIWFLANRVRSLSDVPAELAAALRRRRYWPGSRFPESERERALAIEALRDR